MKQILCTLKCDACGQAESFFERADMSKWSYTYYPNSNKTMDACSSDCEAALSPSDNPAVGMGGMRWYAHPTIWNGR